MRSNRHHQKRQVDLLSFVESPGQRAERVARAGNYATRAVRRWIRSDPLTLAGFLDAVQDYNRSRIPQSPDGLTNESSLAEWFEQTVRTEEISTAYAKFLMESADVDWPMLAAEVTGVWTEDT